MTTAAPTHAAAMLMLEQTFTNFMQRLNLKSQSLPPRPAPTCMISYAWPILDDEANLQERVLRLVADLREVGIDVTLDLLTGDEKTDFSKAVLEWIRTRDFALMIGSRSYAERAKDATTETHMEVKELEEKTRERDGSVIALIMAGGYANALPGRYSGTMCGDLRKTETYLQNVPEVAAKILGFTLGDVEYREELTVYKEETARIVKELERLAKVPVSPAEMKAAADASNMQARYWAGKALVYRAKFTLHQRRILDGQVASRTAKINKYIQDAKHNASTLLLNELSADMTTPDAIPLLSQLYNFLATDQCRVLLLVAPVGAGKTLACQHLLANATLDKDMVPVYIDLTKLAHYDKDLVEQALDASGLDQDTCLHARLEDRRFLLVIEGFDRCHVQTNLYVRNALDKWRGKAVFTCRTDYLAGSHNYEYYFMPADEHQPHQPNPHGLLVIRFTTSHASNLSVESNTEGTVISPEQSIALAPSATQITPTPSFETSSTSPVVSTTPTPSTLLAPLTTPSTTPTHSTSPAPLSTPARSTTATSSSTLPSLTLPSTTTPSPTPAPSSVPPSTTTPSPTPTLPTTKSATTVSDAKQREQGFLLLQHEILQPVLLKLLREIATQAGHLTPGHSHMQAFISYAWPAGVERTQLQGRLLQLVDDMAHVGVEVLLDIRRLSLGINIDRFMKEGIDASKYILWIGSPSLKERIVFKSSGDPANNATVEFVHIRDKLKLNPECLIPLWLSGNSLENAFPSCYPVVGTDLQSFDFHLERDYYRCLPLLVAAMLDPLPKFWVTYAAYYNTVSELELLITDDAISERLAKAGDTLAQQQRKMDEDIQHLVNAIPEHYRKLLYGAEEAQQRALQVHLDQVRDHTLANSAEVLRYYIPLKGGNLPDTPAEFYFDTMEKVQSFLEDDSVKVLLIQGSAGAGKSPFGMHLEQRLWQHDKGKLMPLFVSLPSIADPYHNVIETTLRNKGFSDEQVVRLKISHKLVVILDGLDELSLGNQPPTGLLASNNLLDWKYAKVIITCRPEYLPSLAKRSGSTYQQHITQGLCGITEIYLMPFDTSQVSSFLQVYTKVGNAEWSDWTMYKTQIDTIPGLTILSHTPFILTLLVTVLPRLSATFASQTHKQNVTQSDVYQTFTEQLFEREMWKQITQGEVELLDDRLEASRDLAGRLGQAMFVAGTSQIVTSLTPHEELLLRGLPVLHLPDNNISFVHKSVQEYFTAAIWLRAFASSEVGLVQMLNVRLATEELGLLRFVCQRLTTSHHAPLLALIQTSKQHLTTATAAANAITLLNATSFPFSTMDFSGIRVPGANLDNALLDSANLQGADLTGVSLRQAWLRNADLRGARLSKVQLGEEPGFDCQSPVRCIAVVDGKVVAGCDEYVQVWDIVSGKKLVQTTERGAYEKQCSNTVVVSEQTIITGWEPKYMGGSVAVWDLKTGKKLRRSIGDMHTVKYIAVHEGKILATDGSGHSVHTFDLATGQKVGSPIKTDAIVTGMVVLDGILIAGVGRCVYKLDLATGGIVGKLHGHTYHVTSVVVVDCKIISGSSDKTMRVWDLATGKQLGNPIVGHTGEVTSLAILNKHIISGSCDTTVRVWDLATGQQLEVMRGHSAAVTGVAVFEGKVLSGSLDGTVRVWTWTASQHAGDTIEGHKSKICSVAVSEGFIASGSIDSSLRVWDLETGKEVGKSLEGNRSHVLCVAIYNGKVLSGGDDKKLRVWDLASGKLEREVEYNRPVQRVMVWEANVVAASEKGTVWVWELATGRQIRSLTIHTNESVICMAINNGKVVAGMSHGGLQVWDLATGASIDINSKDYREGVTSVEYANNKIIFGGRDNAIRVWDMASGKRSTMKGHTAEIVAIVAFGDKVLSGSGDRTMRVWSLTTEQQITLVEIPFEVKSVVVSGSNEFVVACETNIQKWRYKEETQQLVLVGGIPNRWPLWAHNCILDESSDQPAVRLLSQKANAKVQTSKVLSFMPF